MPRKGPIYPCGVCHENVGDDTDAIFCESYCALWYHLECLDYLTRKDFELVVQLEDKVSWFCQNCVGKCIPFTENREETDAPKPKTTADTFTQTDENEVTSDEEEINLPPLESGAEFALYEDQSHVVSKYQCIVDGHISSPMSAGTDILPLVPWDPMGLTEVDDAWYQAVLHQTASELIEEIPNECTCVVTVYYNEDESLMIGKASLIHDGGLWENCVKNQRQIDGHSITENGEPMSSETDERIINKFLSFLNTSQSLTVHVPVKLPADFTLPDDFLINPADYGFDIVVLSHKFGKQALMTAYYGCSQGLMTCGLFVCGHAPAASVIFRLQRRVVRIMSGSDYSDNGRGAGSPNSHRSIPFIFDTLSEPRGRAPTRPDEKKDGCVYFPGDTVVGGGMDEDQRL